MAIIDLKEIANVSRMWLTGSVGRSVILGTATEHLLS